MDAADVRVIDGREFASWSVLPGGTQVRLDLVAGNGELSSIVLPFDVLSSLLFTLPRISQAALDERFADPSMPSCIRSAPGDWNGRTADQG
jgi:hypothetical protein